MRNAFRLAIVFLLSTLAPSASAEAPQLIGAYTLPETSITSVQNAVLPGTLDSDRHLFLGGFSDLWRGASTANGDFWTVTDRGPNDTVKVAGAKRRTFPTPTYAPLLLRVAIDGEQLKLLEAIPIVGRSGRPVTGLPNLEPADSPGFDFLGHEALPYNPSGIDVEGMVRSPDGSFWLAEEYRPSILKLDSTGKVLQRFVPAGVKLDGADYEVLDVLPALYARRQDNRGFEGLALSPDGKVLYAALQSALANPNEQVAKNSRNVRILAFDTEICRPVAEYVYPFERAQDFAAGVKPDDLKIGAIALVSPMRLLVLERDDRVAKIFAVELADASNVLDAPAAKAADSTALEAIDDLSASGIRPLPKILVADLTVLPGVPGKLEGMCLVDDRMIAVVNDNDFGFEGFDADGNAVPSGVRTQLLLIKIPSEAGP